MFDEDKPDRNKKKSRQEQLKELVGDATDEYQSLKNLNQRIGLSLGIGSILLSLGATISGITNNSQIAAMLAAVAATTQSVLFAYPVDRRAVFYRGIRAKNKNLYTDLEINTYEDEKLDEFLQEFKTIRIEAALEEPQTSNLADSLDLKNIDKSMAQLKDILEKYDALKNK
jgi:hypothetical protein